MSSSNAYSNDEVIEFLGGFGNFQRILFAISWISQMFYAAQVVILSFAAYTPPYR